MLVTNGMLIQMKAYRPIIRKLMPTKQNKASLSCLWVVTNIQSYIADFWDKTFHIGPTQNAVRENAFRRVGDTDHLTEMCFLYRSLKSSRRVVKSSWRDIKSSWRDNKSSWRDIKSSWRDKVVATSLKNIFIMSLQRFRRKGFFSLWLY